MLLPTPTPKKVEAVKKCFEKSEWRGLASVADETKIPIDDAIDVIDFIGGDTACAIGSPSSKARYNKF